MNEWMSSAAFLDPDVNSGKLRTTLIIMCGCGKKCAWNSNFRMHE